MKTIIHIVSAFTDVAFEKGGNFAGIVLNADLLSAEQKQEIASKVGLSETAFVSRTNIAPFKLEFFTPIRQIAHCGHATIATFSLLRDFGMTQAGLSANETIDGVRQIIIGKDKVFMEQSRPEFVEISAFRPLYQKILNALNLSQEELEDNQNPFIVNTGNKFMIVPIKDSKTLESLKPDMAMIEEISKTFGLIGFYPFTFETSSMNRVASARMFAPIYGINEESATGMAAGCLAAYLHCIRGIEKNSFQIEQGHLMSPPSPSLISVHIKQDDNERIKSILVGGRAKLERVMELEI